MTHARKTGYRITGQSISWVGECPWTDTLCFGSEEGNFVVCPGGPGTERANTKYFPLATDAINSIAFDNDLFALSSRNEVVIGRRPDSLDGTLDSYKFNAGAHGVVASGTGAFLAPIGDQGFLILKLDVGELAVETVTNRDFPFNFYRLIRLGMRKFGEETFASAGRNDGLLAFSLSSGPHSPSSKHHCLETHDIIDVCSLNDPRYPHAVACLSRNRVIFLIRDVFADQEPVTLNYCDLQGVAYTLLSARGHLFLLTDRELVALPNVASRFLRGETPAGPLKIACFPVNVSETFFWRDQAILLIEEDSSVGRLEIEDLIDATEPTQRQAGLESNGQPHQESGSGTTDEVRLVEKIAPDVKIVETVPVPSGWHTNDPFNLILTPFTQSPA
jgi:hypothetical protein